CVLEAAANAAAPVVAAPRTLVRGASDGAAVAGAAGSLTSRAATFFSRLSMRSRRARSRSVSDACASGACAGSKPHQQTSRPARRPITDEEIRTEWSNIGLLRAFLGPLLLTSIQRRNVYLRGYWPSSARLSFSTLTRGSPKRPSSGPSV